MLALIGEGLQKGKSPTEQLLLVKDVANKISQINSLIF